MHVCNAWLMLRNFYSGTEKYFKNTANMISDWNLMATTPKNLLVTLFIKNEKGLKSCKSKVIPLIIEFL